jgi:glycerophosphoryl diester phosphodiesterase
MHSDHLRPIVIGHRGASGYVPEHTLLSYFIAAHQGADYVEPDLVMTRDGVLVARHENEISGTTDVANRPEFASRRTSKSIDGVAVSGWFTEDFTLAELKTLRARERLPELRHGNMRFDGMFEIPTLDEIIGLVHALDAQRERSAQSVGLPRPKPIGIYPETKHPSYFQALGLPMEKALVQTLHANGYSGADAAIFIQSFEVANMRELRRLTQLPLVQLVGDGKPYDFVVSNDARGYADLLTPSGLSEIARYANAVGADKSLIVPRVGDKLGSPTRLVADAHVAGLMVHGWTFRAENAFLPLDLRSGSDPAALGDLSSELRAFLATGMDGFFTDHPDIGVRVRDAFVAGR